MSAEVLLWSPPPMELKFFLGAPDTYIFPLKKVLTENLKILNTEITGEINGVSGPAAD